MQDDTRILPTLTLDEITNRYPATIDVFNRLGMDMCCGGAVTLAEAAERDGVRLDIVIEALREALLGADAGRRP